MYQSRAVVLAFLMMTSSLSLILVSEPNSNYDISEETIFTVLSDEKVPSFPSPGNPWVEDSLFSRINNGDVKIRVTVITWSLAELNHWQLQNNAFDQQAGAKNGETFQSFDPTSGEIDHRTFWMLI